MYLGYLTGILAIAVVCIFAIIMLTLIPSTGIWVLASILVLIGGWIAIGRWNKRWSDEDEEVEEEE